MAIPAQSTHRRLSSLQAAGVSSSSSPAITTKKKTAVPDPISTTNNNNAAAARLAARRSSMGINTKSPATTSKTPLVRSTRPTSSSSNNASPTLKKTTITPTVKKKTLTPTTVKKTTITPTPASARRSSSRLSMHGFSVNGSHPGITSPTASINGIKNMIATDSSSSTNSASTVKSRSSSIHSPPKRSTVSLVIEDFKDKKNEMQKLLKEKQELVDQKQELIVQKDTELKELQGKLDALQHELEEKNSALEEMSAKITENSSSTHEEALQRQVEQLQSVIDAYETQIQEIKQTFETERLRLVQQHEEAEEKNRENMERLREKLLDEKDLLNSTIAEKDRAFCKLQKDMDEMRDNIQAVQEMHQSHQTRLTTLTSLLNEKHAKYINELKLEHENQLKVMNDKQVEFEKQLYEKTKELAANINSEKYHQEFKEQLDAVNKEHAKTTEKLNKDHTRVETELHDAMILLERTSKTNQDMESQIEEMQSLVSNLKASSKVEKDNLRKDLENQLQQLIEQSSKEMEELKALHRLELAENETKMSAHENEIQEFKSTNEQRLSDLSSVLENESSQHKLLQTKYGLLEKELEKTRQAEQRANERANHTILSQQIELEEVSKSYKDLMARNHSVIQAKQDHQEKLQNEMHALISQHESILNELKEEHNRQLKAAEVKASSQTEKEITLKQQFESKIKTLEQEKQCLENELQEQLVVSDQNMKKAELEHSAKCRDLKDQLDESKKLETEYSEELRIQELQNHYQMNQLQEQLNKLQAEIKACHVEYNQSRKSNNDSNELNSVKVFFENLLATKDKELKRLKCETESRMQGIIEQHQKELNTLQKQFQSLLDMKDKELKDLSFKLKTTNGSLSTEVEQELRAQLQTLEQDMKSKSLEMRWLESDSEQNETKLKEQGILVQTLQYNTAKLEKTIKRYKQENEHMLRLIHQLQGHQ